MPLSGFTAPNRGNNGCLSHRGPMVDIKNLVMMKRNLKRFVGLFRNRKSGDNHSCLLWGWFNVTFSRLSGTELVMYLQVSQQAQPVHHIHYSLLGLHFHGAFPFIPCCGSTHRLDEADEEFLTFKPESVARYPILAFQSSPGLLVPTANLGCPIPYQLRAIISHWRRERS